MKKKKTGLYLGLIIIFIMMVLYFRVPGSVTNYNNEPVYLPQYGIVECQQVGDPDYFPAKGEFHTQEELRASYFCSREQADGNGLYHMPVDADYLQGCDVYVEKSGFDILEGIVRDITIRICNRDGTNCDDAPETKLITYFGKSTVRFHITENQKLFIERLSGINIRVSMQGQPYGLRVTGSGVTPQFSKRCNLASFLNEKQWGIFMDRPDAWTLLKTTELQTDFPIVVVTQYAPAIGNKRIFQKDGKWWWASSVGQRCEIKKASDGKFYGVQDGGYVSDVCVQDDSIQCIIPGVYCTDDFKIVQNTLPSGTTCQPGTLIGSSVGRIPTTDGRACKYKCSDAGIVTEYSCVDIPKTCPGGQVLNSDYVCVDSGKLTLREECLAGGGKYVPPVFDTKGNIDKQESCDYGGGINVDTTLLITIALIGGIVLLLVAIVNKKKR